MKIGLNANKKPHRSLIYSRLVEDIVNGTIYPGEKLLESQLAERFHVSRTPIREALLQLEKEGFVSHTKNVGAVVKKISIGKVREIYEIVTILESYALGQAVEKLSEKDIAYLKDLQRSMEEKLLANQFSLYVKLNAEFHDYVVRKSGNETLRDIALDLRKSIYRLVVEGKTVPVHRKEYIKAHRAIIAALVKRDASNAADLMASHLRNTKDYLLEVLSSMSKANF
jgi:DNA-binding GntR family transcriptional regulator